MKSYHVLFVYTFGTSERTCPIDFRDVVTLAQAQAWFARQARAIAGSTFVKCEVLRESTAEETGRYFKDARALNRCIERAERCGNTKTGTPTVL